MEEEGGGGGVGMNGRRRAWKGVEEMGTSRKGVEQGRHGMDRIGYKWIGQGRIKG
jgi:hypothetical protein